MPMSRSISHALPVMRDRLVRAHYNAEISKTKRDRLAGFKEAFAWASAIKVLLDSDDYTSIDGIMDVEGLPSGSLKRCREWLGQDADKILGPELVDSV